MEEQATLDGLDFMPDETCDVLGCDGEYAATVKYQVHPECQAHTKTYLHCYIHTAGDLAGKVHCKRCQQPLKAQTVSYIK